MRVVIGSISILEIQKQINSATLSQLQEYSEVLATDNPNLIESFLWDATHKKHGSKRMVLIGEGFKVSACVLAMSLEYQHSAYNLAKAMEYGLWDEDGCSIRCSLSEDEKSIEFWYNA